MYDQVNYTSRLMVMIRRGLKPGLRFGFDRSIGRDGFRRVLPFRRPWIALLVVAAMDIAFILPAISVFRHATAGWSEFDTLFDLVITLFMSAWLLGWAVAPLSLSLILVLLLFGREVISAQPGRLEISLGLPGLGFTTRYDVSKMRNLRRQQPAPRSGKSWRGSHLVFDYGANQVAFGSAIDRSLESEIRQQIKASSGVAIHEGEVLPEDDLTPWEPDEKPPTPLPLATEAIESEPLTLASASSIALIVANLIPVAGTVFLDWNLGDVMVLYWAESAVVGFFNLLKIIVIGRWAALFYGPFFVGHFGGFMAVHFLFIYTIFVTGLKDDMSITGDLSQVQQLFIALWPALAALFISHAYSFFHNFIGRREFQNRNVSDQMGEPYSRIIFMHLVLILGGGLVLVLGQATPVLLIVIGLKIYFDLKGHLKQRARS